MEGNIMNDSTLVQSKKFYTGEKLSYGMLAMKQESYDYFNGFVMDNKLSMEMCVTAKLNIKMVCTIFCNGVIERKKGLNVNNGFKAFIFHNCKVH